MLEIDEVEQLRAALAERFGCHPHSMRVSVAMLAIRLVSDAIETVMRANSRDGPDNPTEADSRLFLENDGDMLSGWLSVAGISGRTKQQLIDYMREISQDKCGYPQKTRSKK